MIEKRKVSRIVAIACAVVSRAAFAQQPPSAAASNTPIEPPVVQDTAPAMSAEPETASHSWFWRPPLRVEVGEGPDRWAVNVFGFIEADYIVDSTRSYDDSIGGTLVARSDSYAGQTGRTQFSARNSRLGMLFTSPVISGMKGSAVLEADFFGNQPQGTSERSFFDSPGFRLRHAYLQLQNDYVDVLAGHTYTLFGWQNYFFPASIEYLGLPNQLFTRSAQLRLSHRFAIGDDFSVDVAAAAVRPAQRDSSVPDVHAGVRLSANNWKGITTPGSLGTLAAPMSLGISSTVRQFKVNAFTPPPTRESNHATGWGVSIDALVPIIAAANADDRANRLTFTGAFVTGTGIADLITSGGGASFPPLPNPAQANPAPVYAADIDNGLVSFDSNGVLHPIDWWAMRAGLQYYLPPSGRFFIAVNYTQSHSDNMAQLFPKDGSTAALVTHVADRSHYADINLFWDATPSIRFGVSGQYTKVIYLDGNAPHNLRGMATALYAF